MSKNQDSFPKIMIQFHHAETTFPNRIDCPSELNVCDMRVTCTLHVGHIVHDHLPYDKYEYAFQYSENGAIGCLSCCCPRASCLGYHEHDREKLILLTSPNTHQIQHVYFKAHGRGQGLWLPWSECEKTPDGHLIAYVAKGSHAFYPRPERYWRVFGFANDICSNRGQRHLIQVIANHDDETIPPETSITKCERIFIAFIQNRIQTRP